MYTLKKKKHPVFTELSTWSKYFSSENVLYTISNKKVKNKCF